MQDNLALNIQLTTELLDINKILVEKDYHVTRVIHALSGAENEYFKLVFQGGTCLSKAHRITQRMSEDCDFRMEAKTLSKTLSKTALRNELREFRASLIQILIKNGFPINKDKIKVRDEGNFMRFWAPYDTLYPDLHTFKPDILLEFIKIGTKTPTVNLPVTTLIKQTLGKAIDHAEKNIDCVSVTETAAEKWVALTRRVARAEANGYRNSDMKLIRHIYDLNAIAMQNVIGTEFSDLVSNIVLEERLRYKNHSETYYLDPVQEIKKAIDALRTNPIWQNYWHKFTTVMVFQREKPKFEEVIKTLITNSEKAITSIQENSKKNVH